MTKNTVSTIGLRSVLVALASLEVKTNEVLTKAAISRKIIDDADGRISPTELNDFWLQAVHYLNDPLLAINFSRYIPFGTYQITDHLLSSASNLQEGLNRYIKYYSIVNQDIHLQLLDMDKNFVGIVISQKHANLFNHYVLDFEIGLLANRLRIVTKNKIQFSKINISYGNKEFQERYEKILDSIIEYDLSDSMIIFDKKYLKLPCSESNSNLFDFIEKTAKVQISKLEENISSSNIFLNTFYNFIKDNLKDGDFSIEAVAKSQNMSVRTFQRKLKEYNLSYKETLVQTRKELAVNLLEDLNLSIAEIAYLTGFSEASAFHRAFKQWTGKTPFQYRKET